MKAFVLISPGVVGWIDDAPEPVLQSRGAILRPVAVSPCTSDVHTVFGGGSPKAPNLILGHECVARVEQIGSEVRDFQVGEVVAVPAITPDWRALAIQDGNFCHAGRPFSGHQLGRTMPGVFAERFAIPDADTTLAKIPENVTLEQALMCVDVVTTGFTAAECGGVKFGDVVCVMGIGAIGLMAICGARCMGAARIIAVGSRPHCQQLALEYGATDIVDYKQCNTVERVLELTNGLGVDATLIAGGDDSVLEQAYQITKYGIGTISNVNYFGGTGNLPVPKFSGGKGMCGKTLRMELARGGRARIERMLAMCQFGRINPQKLVNHVMTGMDKIGDALLLMRDKTIPVIKIMVKYDE